MAKKKRKPPAKAPAIRQRTPSEELYEDDPPRLDPDQPPADGTMQRPSIYSEWLNSPSSRPTIFTQWLNLPPQGPSPANPGLGPPGPPPPPSAPAAPRGAKVNGAAAPSEIGGVENVRRRKTSAARRLTAAERLEMDALSSPPARRRQGPAPGRPEQDNLPRSTRLLPALPEEPMAPPRRATTGRPPTTLGETTARIPTSRQGTAGQLPAGRLPARRHDGEAREPSNGHETSAGLAVSRRTTAAALPATRRTGGSLAASYESPDSSVLIRGARHPRPSLPIVPRRLRPPSAVMQVAVALVTVLTLLGALSVASPLGYGTAISGTIQAYANAMVWVPTPTPTATAAPPSPAFAVASPGQQVVIDTIKSVFGQYSTGALNVARCESGYDPSARNPYPVGNSHAEGVFQILYPSTWNTTSYAAQNPYDYNANIRAAWQIFSRDGYSWREWACQP